MLRITKNTHSRAYGPGAQRATSLASLADGAALRALARRNAGVRTRGDDVMTAIDAALHFARQGFHDAARSALGVALATIRCDRSPQRPFFRFRLLCGAAYLAYARGKMLRAERIIGYALAQAAILPAEERARALDLARSNLARIFERTGRLPEALELREIAVREAPSSVNVLNLAFAYNESADYGRVLNTLEAPAVVFDTLETANAELLRAVALARMSADIAARRALRRYRRLARAHGLVPVAF